MNRCFKLTQAQAKGTRGSAQANAVSSSANATAEAKSKSSSRRSSSAAAAESKDQEARPEDNSDEYDARQERYMLAALDSIGIKVQRISYVMH